MNRDYLLQCLDYNGESGILTWKKRPRDHFTTDRGYNTFTSQKVGKVTGCKSHTKDGLTYLKIAINKKLYLAHRLAWTIHHGEIPVGFEIDHVDHDGTNNAILNLRLVTSSMNKRNRTMVCSNSSGHMGVYLNKKINKWVAEIVVDGVYHGLGSYADFNEAVAVRKNAEINFDFHKNHGGEKVVIS